MYVGEIDTEILGKFADRWFGQHALLRGGPGTITLDIARRVAPARVTGLDPSADVIAQARRDAEGAQ